MVRGEYASLAGNAASVEFRTVWVAWTGDITKVDLAVDLAAVRRGRFTITSRRGTGDAVSLDTADELGQDLERDRVSAGWRRAGWRVGFTSQALWSRLGLDGRRRALAARNLPCRRRQLRQSKGTHGADTVRAAPTFVVPLMFLLLLAACGSAPAETPAGSGTERPSGTPSASAGTPSASAGDAAETPAGSGTERPSGTPSASAGTPSASAGDAAVDAAASVLTAARLSDADSLAALQGLRFTAAGTAAAARLLSSGVTGDTLWAATYVYASSGGDPAPLRPIASTTASPSIRAMAAAGLVGRGELEGFDPLIAALDGSDPMDGAEPAEDIWEFAADVLERYTQTGFGPTLAATEAERATIQAHWKAWLDANRAHLRFDPSSELWVTV